MTKKEEFEKKLPIKELHTFQINYLSGETCKIFVGKTLSKVTQKNGTFSTL